MIGGYHPWFHQELQRLVEVERREKAEDMARGACGDFADYRYAVGYVDGMNRVLELADDIRKKQDPA